MNLRRVIAAFALLLLAVPAWGRDHTDIIIMKNGDHLTGEVKGINAGVLYVDLNYVDGTVSLQWSQVAHLESNQPFIVKTEEGSVYSGTLKTLETPLGDPIKIQVTDRAERAEAALEGPHIVSLEQTSESFWRRMNGAISFGTTYTKGNQSTQYSLSSQVEYLRERWNAGASFNSNLSSSIGAQLSSRNQLGIDARHLLPWKNYFYGGLGSFLQSSEQGIQLQTNLGVGIGRYLENSNHASVSVLAGAAWQRTGYTESTVSVLRQNVAAAVVSSEVKVFVFKKTNLSITANFFPAVSDPGRVFVNTNATYYLKLFHNLSWNLSFYGDWDNQPPANFSGSDYGSSVGLSWTFGNR
jgi:Protein of unknown function, DUF481